MQLIVNKINSAFELINTYMERLLFYLRLQLHTA